MTSEKKQISLMIFFWSYLLASFFGLFFLENSGQSDRDSLGFSFGCLLNVYAVILFLVFIYRIWKAVPREVSRTTPGKAVGFLLIPFFNLYWWFEAIWGWTKDFNKPTRSGTSGNRVSEGLGLLTSLFTFTTAILGIELWLMEMPRIAITLAYLNLIVSSLFIFKSAQAVNNQSSSTAVPLTKELALIACIPGLFIALICFSFAYHTAIISEYVPMSDVLHWFWLYMSRIFKFAYLAVFLLFVVIRISRLGLNVRYRLPKITITLILMILCMVAVFGRAYNNRGDNLIARSTKTPAEWLRLHANTSHDKMLLKYIANNPNCPKDVLDQLLADPSNGVRISDYYKQPANTLWFVLAVPVMGYKIIVRIIIDIVVIIIMWIVAKKKGFNPWLWFLTSGVPGIIILLCMPSANAQGIDNVINQKRRETADTVGIAMTTITVIAFIVLIHWISSLASGV